MHKIIFIVPFLFLSCASLPQITEDLASNDICKKCKEVYVKKSYRFIHSIEATFPNGKKGIMMGITKVSPEKGSLHSVLMSIEGLVIFDGIMKEKLTVNRAIPPFDDNDFAKGVMDDIWLVYFKPKGGVIGRGRLQTGTGVCRFKENDGYIDVLFKEGNTWQINKYSSSKGLVRTVEGAGLNIKGIPRKITLTAPGILGYSLLLKLLEYEPF